MDQEVTGSNPVSGTNILVVARTLLINGDCGIQGTASRDGLGYKSHIKCRFCREFLGDPTMRIFVAFAIIISAAIGLGGCFGHHEKAVVVEPLKLG